MKPVSLYFHIPFCTKKCPYCHFYVVPNKQSHHAALLEGLLLEWEKNLPLLKDTSIVSLYFGGGTPSLFGHKNIGALLDTINRTLHLAPDCEITLEANPEEGTIPFLKGYRDLGINRLSLGVQSLDNRSLETLERTHSAQKAIETLHHAEKAGFQNVSIDLMYDLPGQTRGSWQHTLDQLSTLPFQHLSLYNLTIEPHTSFFKRKPTLPDAQDSLYFLHSALETMERLGLKRYEISAFARDGHTSRHNLGYWTGRPFLGYGPSAFSDWDGERFRNEAHLLRYLRNLKENQSPVDFRERLDPEARARERLAVALRVLDGVEWKTITPDTRLILQRLCQEGYLIHTDDRIALSEKGTLFYDTVAAEII